VKLRWGVARLQALFRQRKLDGELDGEILAYLELAERDAIAAGLTAEEARQAASRNFGGIEQMKEDHRDQRSVRWMENLLRDFRYGLASLARDPGFAAVTIGLLALGIGANTAMFSIVDAVLLKPLPFRAPERMVRVRESPPGGRNPTTTLTFLDWKRQNDIFEGLSAEERTKAAVATGGDPVRISGKTVSADYFQVFGVRAQIGRTFAPGEDQPGAAPVVVLAHRPLFDLDPAWDWATRDGDKVMALLLPHANVTVFYGHIHQEHHHRTEHIAHHAAKSLIFPLPAPGSQDKRTPLAWDATKPYKGLGIREVEAELKTADYQLSEFPVIKG